MIQTCTIDDEQRKNETPIKIIGIDIKPSTSGKNETGINRIETMVQNDRKNDAKRSKSKRKSGGISARLSREEPLPSEMRLILEAV